MRFPLLTALLVSAAPPPGDIMLDRAAPVVEADVAGTSARLAVTLDQGVYLSAPFATRVPLSWGPGGYEEVGRVRVRFRQAMGRLTIGGVAHTVKMQTRDGPCCAGRNGAIGATELPWPIVRFGQAQGIAEQRYPAAIDTQSGLSIPWKLDGTTIHILLAPDQAETVATAAAAAALAKAYGGHFVGQGREAVLAFGVTRVVRDMALDRPAMLPGGRLDRIAVRLADFGGGKTLPQEPDDGGSDAIVVKRKLAAQRGWAAITIGRDRLDRCPAIAVYRDEPAIGLACRPT